MLTTEQLNKLRELAGQIECLKPKPDILTLTASGSLARYVAYEILQILNEARDDMVLVPPDDDRELDENWFEDSDMGAR